MRNDDDDDDTEDDPDMTWPENSSPETRRKSRRKTEKRHLVKCRKTNVAPTDALCEPDSTTEEEDDDDVLVKETKVTVKEGTVKEAEGEDCTEGSRVEVSYWKPSPEVKSVLDKVSITDVSCEDVTITVKECTTDDGFFKKKNKDDDT